MPDEFSDDFERADGPLGDNWVLLADTGYATATVEPFSIASGAAIAPVDTAPKTQMRWHAAQPDDQSIGITVENAMGNNGYFALFTNANTTDSACLMLEINFGDAMDPPWTPTPDDELYLVVQHFPPTGSPSYLDSVTLPYPVSEPVAFRFESAADGTQQVYVDDTLVLTVVDPAPVVGPYVGMGMSVNSHLGVYTSPRILQAGSGGGDELCDDFERADGPLGDDWVVGAAPGSAEVVVPLSIEAGAAIGPTSFGVGDPYTENGMYRAATSGPDQFVEAAVDRLYQPGGPASVHLFCQVDGRACIELDVSATATAVTFTLSSINDQFDPADFDTESVAYTGGTDAVHLIRLESIRGGRHTAFLNGVEILHLDDSLRDGNHVGIGTAWQGDTRTSPRFLSVCTNVGDDGGGGGGIPPVPPFRFSNRLRPRIQLRGPVDWIDLHCHAHEMEFVRGRERFNDRFQPGTATLTISNADGYGDLYGTPDEIAARELRPGRGIRLGVNIDGDDYPMWTGIIDSCTPVYDPVEHDVVTVNAIDILGEVGSTKLLALTDPVGQGEDPAARINRILDEAQWTATGRILDASTTRLAATTLNGQAIDLLGLTAESAGGAVFADVDGNIVFREFGWQIYSGTDPPAGVLGNVAPGDTCPTGWEESFDRADIVTQVVLNRTPPPAVSPLNYTVPADSAEAATPTPGPGSFHANSFGPTGHRATELYIHEITADGLNAEDLLRAVTTDSRIGTQPAAVDPHPTYRQSEWQALGPATFLAGVYTIPVVTIFPPDPAMTDKIPSGANRIYFAFPHLDPLVVDDPDGIALYGLQNQVSLTDLICLSDDKFPKMVEGIFGTRGYTSMPRLEAVTLDASAARDHAPTLQLMAAASPETPSRFHCRLHQRGRPVFNRHMFVTSVRHFMSPDEWTVRIGLDAAEWAASTGGRFIFPGVAGNYLSTPNIVAAAVNDLEILIRVQAAWDTAPTDYGGILFANACFGVRRQTGSVNLACYVYDLAGTATTVTATPPTYWTNNDTVWLRITATSSVMRFEWTGDTGQLPAAANWQLLATQTRTATGIHAATGDFVIGSGAATGGDDMFAGRVRRVIVRTGAEVAGAELSEPFDDYTDNWILRTGAPTTVTGRNGLGAVELSGVIYRAFTGVSDTVLVGFAVASNGVGTALLDMLRLYATGDTALTSPEVALQITTGGALTAAGASSAAGLIVDGVWNYVEIQVKRANAPDGFVTVHLNGTTVINATGIDTLTYPAGTTFSTLELVGPATGLHRFDDLYIKTGTGASFAGDQSIGISETVLLDVSEDDVGDHLAATFEAASGQTVTEHGDVIAHPYIPVYP